jgi:predicted RNA-binding Zn-ribbon protein involved in translation (DUF1610 family)
MPLTVTCPGCNSPLRVREEYAGKKLKCPRCSGIVEVPNGEAAPETVEPLPVEEVLPAPRPGKRQAEPVTAIGEGAPARRPGGHGRHDDTDEPEGERPRRRGKDYKPCPRCGSGGATRVTWTPWGSFYGPALLTHVRCPKCGYAYNGRTGRSNTVAAVFFVLIPLILILGIIFGLLLALRIIRL